MLGRAELQTTSIYLNVTRTGIGELMLGLGTRPPCKLLQNRPGNDPRPLSRVEGPAVTQVSVSLEIRRDDNSSGQCTRALEYARLASACQ